MSAPPRVGGEAEKRLLELWRIRELRVAWLACLEIVIALVIAFWVGSERAFRFTGLFLQAVGIVAVAWNIRDAQKRNNHPGIFAAMIEWWRRVLGIKRPTILTADSSSGISWAGARPNIWHGARPDATLEEQVDILNTNVIGLKERLGQFEQDTAENLNRQAEALNQEKRVRAQEDMGIHENLKVAQVGGLDVAMAGLVSLGIGVIMSTSSIELAGLVSSPFP